MHLEYAPERKLWLLNTRINLSRMDFVCTLGKYAVLIYLRGSFPNKNRILRLVEILIFLQNNFARLRA